MKTARAVVLTVIAIVLASAAVCYGFLISEGLSAGRKPSDFEYDIANYALSLSIPSAAKKAKNPINPSPDDMIGAKKDFSDYCSVCHGEDGAGRTETARGLSPEVPDLHAAHIQKLTDGEMFYIIKNGVRFTGMPGWHFQDQRIWKLVALIRGFTLQKAPNSAH
jgi:cytochrome c553